VAVRGYEELGAYLTSEPFRGNGGKVLVDPNQVSLAVANKLPPEVRVRLRVCMCVWEPCANSNCGTHQALLFFFLIFRLHRAWWRPHHPSRLPRPSRTTPSWRACAGHTCVHTIRQLLTTRRVWCHGDVMHEVLSVCSSVVSDSGRGGAGVVLGVAGAGAE
jgi:hypothetical protein